MHLFSFDEHLPGVDRSQAEDRLRRFASSGADQSGNAQNFSFSDRKGDILEIAFLGQSFDRQHFLTLFFQIGIALAFDFAADHHGNQIRLCHLFGIDRIDILPVTEDCETVGHMEQFFHLMTDEHDGDILCLQIFNDLIETFYFLFRKSRSRFVHDDHLCFLRNGCGNSYHLLLGNRQVPDDRPRIDIRFQKAQSFFRLGVHFLPVKDFLVFLNDLIDTDILCHCQVCKQTEILIDNRNAFFYCIHRIMQHRLLPFDHNLCAVIRRLDTGKNLDQR